MSLLPYLCAKQLQQLCIYSITWQECLHQTRWSMGCSFTTHVQFIKPQLLPVYAHKIRTCIIWLRSWCVTVPDGISASRQLNKHNTVRWRHRMEIFFCVTGLLWGESTGHRWFALTKASDAELWWFLWCTSELTVAQTIKTTMIWDPMALIVTSF